MSGIPIVRAAHLLLCVEVMRDIGVPVERELARSGLPTWVEETPDAYVSMPLALDWVRRCSRDAGAMELGFLAARRMSFGTFGHTVRTAVMAAPTGHARIDALARLAHREDSALAMEVRREGSNTRIICDLPAFRGAASLGFAEWLNVTAIVSVVRTAAGPAWCPEEMTFTSRSMPSDAALEAFANSRILVGQPHNSIVVPGAVLARTAGRLSAVGADASPVANPAGAWDFATALRSVIRPYLGDGHPDVALAAEIAGMSKRSFQRRLQGLGLTYSQLVQEVRFDIARDLLADTSCKIIDVAFAAGYDNPQHFTRAFRRFAGVTPTAFRGMRPEA